MLSRAHAFTDDRSLTSQVSDRHARANTNLSTALRHERRTSVRGACMPGSGNAHKSRTDLSQTAGGAWPRRAARLPAVGGIAQLGGHLEARPAEHTVLGEQVQPARTDPALLKLSLTFTAVALCVDLDSGTASEPHLPGVFMINATFRRHDVLPLHSLRCGSARRGSLTMTLVLRCAQGGVLAL